MAKKFRDMWTNQTELGKRFGISAIKVGKILIQHGLKDPNTKDATKKALEEQYAQFTPLKDGTHHYLWNIQKLQTLLGETQVPLDEVAYWVNEVKRILKEADRLAEEGQDKLAYLAYDFVYDEVPKHIRKKVRCIVEKL